MQLYIILQLVKSYHLLNMQLYIILQLVNSYHLLNMQLYIILQLVKPFFARKDRNVVSLRGKNYWIINYFVEMVHLEVRA